MRRVNVLLSSSVLFCLFVVVVCLFLFYASLKVLVTHAHNISHLIFPRNCESHSLDIEMAGY